MSVHCVGIGMEMEIGPWEWHGNGNGKWEGMGIVKSHSRTSLVRSMGFMHAMHEQVFGVASMVDFGQSDTTSTLKQV